MNSLFRIPNSKKLFGIWCLVFGISACLPKPTPTKPGDPEWGLQITWHGQSCFTLKDSVGRTVVIDPFDDTVGYGRLALDADALLITHEHFDHNEKRAVRPLGKDLDLVVSTPTQVVAGSVIVTGILSDHDNDGGEINGKNRMYLFQMGGLRIAHLGDLGQDSLTQIQKSFLGQVDVLFVPVGGVVTIDAAQAKKVVEALNPRFIFPMHYGNIRFYHLNEVDDFLKLFPEANIVKSRGSSVRVKMGATGPTPRVYVLNPTPHNS
jgi:L-ascorbate metabolism protein UlaG (beta-lactamase superfamily)